MKTVWILLLFILVACNTSTPSSGGSSNVVEQWIAAVEKGDTRTAQTFMVNPSFDWSHSIETGQRDAWTTRRIVPSDKPDMIRLQWERPTAREQSRYICMDYKEVDGKIKADRTSLCTETGSFDFQPK